MLDLIIVGASAAGCSAAVYAARRKLNFKIITDNVGGEVALSGEVNNWPGITSIQGFDLAQKFAEHVRFYGVNIEEGWKITNIENKKNFQLITIKNDKNNETILETKAVLIATGIYPRRLDIPGEKEFDRKGVTYCTVCDGPLFKNKITATIGSGNSALESVLMMSKIAQKVYLISKFPNDKKNNFGFPKGEKILVDKIKSLPNVEIIYNAETLAITGQDKVTALKYRDEKGENNLIVGGVMVHIGMTPNSQFIKNIKKDKAGQIIVNEKCQTSRKGIFAAGDVTNVAYKQIGIAAGQGIIAALAAIEHINKWK
ncbi:MAG: hypothetical protein COU29_01850 [Candidatus Magasanikbacteria bacterium CG10_big_fil_rev_8_21_14_0_10_36_32]|uniref:FAD/NAD(P)-binding domain-containing protein n=1 Tax=Candidatus Magasanikbacteria bacterium CG10_big_fil_rev_8_21_14_0_10_36_32 TaxID=1974646 RepID=A0A2M6W6V2_9BACT|nr:MAG: hypothetical protein COU29_01850 [Candidatus Magasanikbacteria bacterium CG10_big_fil_rev_8_21_14_0_10_36_32]